MESILAGVPDVARGIKNLRKNVDFFVAHVNPGIPGFPKKIQPIQSSRLASYREHIYECLVLLYRYIGMLIYINKVISVCLFACLFVFPIITQETIIDRFASHFDWGA